MKYAYTFLTFILVLMITGCSTGRKALEQGDYDRAVTQAINRLRSNGSSEKARATLRKAYNLAMEVHIDRINRAQASPDPLKWEEVVFNYRQINAFYDEILRCPACREVIPRPAKYDAELTSASNKAAENRYNMGVAALKFKQDRVKAMEAHQHFLRARDFVPRYKDVENKIQEAKMAATLRVVVEPIPAPMRSLNVKHEFFVNKINEYLHRNRINEYVQFFTPEEVKSLNLDYVDHIIRMEFDQFSLGNVHTNTVDREVSRDSVVIAEKNGEKIYGTVKARLKVFEKAITGDGVLDFRIVDNNLNRVITQEKMPSSYTWVARWASFNGDERALSDEEREMVKRSEVSIPHPQWMFEEFTAPLYDQVISKIRHFYRNY